MPVPELHATSPKWQAGSRQLAGAGPVHTRVLPVASQSAGTAVRLLLLLKVTASILEVSADPGGGSASSTSPSRHSPPHLSGNCPGCEPTRAGMAGPAGAALSEPQ